MDPEHPVVEPAVRLIPLGGLGEIGLNMMLVEFADELIAVDCGLMFPDADEMPGIDYVIPDFSYAIAKRDGFRAVFLTHGHEDHVGALPYLLREARVPVYGTPLTLGLLAEKLREHDLEDVELRVMRPRDRIEVGSFRVEPLRVTHSIADGIGLVIETPVGTIFHTGDFKLDPTPVDGEAPDYQRFEELGHQGVLVLCSDSTNVHRPGHTRSEADVGQALGERFVSAKGRIILATFASHIHRIQHVLSLAARFDRKVAIVGMSLARNVRVAAELGYLHVPSDVLIWTTRPPVGVPLAIEMVTVAWVPSPVTARLVTVIAPSTELFRKNVTPFAPAKPAPVSVMVTLLPGAALDGATALMNGSTDTATPAAEFVAEDGAGGGGSTRTLAGAAAVVAEDAGGGGG